MTTVKLQDTDTIKMLIEEIARLKERVLEIEKRTVVNTFPFSEGMTVQGVPGKPWFEVVRPQKE